VPDAPLRPWQIDVSALRRAQAVHTVLLQVILILLVAIAGTLAGLATATVATRDVVAALDDPAATSGPMEAAQFRSLRAITAYYRGGRSLAHAAILSFLGAAFLVLALAVRRRLLPEGVSRRRLAITLAALAAVAALAVILGGPFAEIGRRVAVDRHLLLRESTVWSNAVELSYAFHGPLAFATLAAALAALSARRTAVVGLAVLAAAGYAALILFRLPWGPFAAPAEPPPSFLDFPGRSVRLLVLDGRPRVVHGVLPDVGLASDPPPVGLLAEQAAETAARQFGPHDLRGAVARLLHAVAPLARVDAAEYARRTAALYAETRCPGALGRLLPLLRSPLPRGAADPALAAFADVDRLHLGTAAVDLCRALAARGELDAAAKVKDAARAEGLDERLLGECVVAAPAAPGSAAGTVLQRGKPLPGATVALADERLAGPLGTTPEGGTVDLASLAAALTARTDAAGRYEFPAVPPGRYRLLVLLEDPRIDLEREPPPPAAVDVAESARTGIPPISFTVRSGR
jgi:hypothetical protein